jgi:uncharacterized protein YbjT (DUF2867 family)
MSTILVTAATGNVGSHVVRELRAAGESVRCFVRDAAAATTKIGSDVELAVGDFEDADSIRSALVGVDRLFLNSPNSPKQVAHETAVVDAAREAGVRRIVKLSTVLAEAGSPLPGMDWNGRNEDYLRRSGIAWVILRSNWMMTNLLMSADMVAGSGKLFAAAGGGKISMIDPRDVAAAAAGALTGDDLDNRTYVLTGGEAVTYDDVARELSVVTGRPVDFVDVPAGAAPAAFAEAGLPDWLVAHLLGAFALVREGSFAVVSDDVQLLTGRPPRTLEAFVRDHAAAFRP